MCNIAGFIGRRQAAPILLEMLLRQEGLAGGGIFLVFALCMMGSYTCAR